MAYSWYFTREDLEHKSPSREHGITSQLENKYRREGARFIVNASNALGLHYDTTATGVTFFHRFFMIQSFKTYDRWVVSSACLLLAGKVEETPKKCKDILKVVKAQLTEHQWLKFGNEPKEELLTHERILLQTIKFDLQVQHPYEYVLKFAKALRGEKSKVEKLVQMAWNFVNDSLCTTLCLQWEPQCLAVAFLYLAGKTTKYDMQAATCSHSKSWWRGFVATVDSHDLESICHQVLDTYSENSMENQSATTPPETPNTNTIASTPTAQTNAVKPPVFPGGTSHQTAQLSLAPTTLAPTTLAPTTLAPPTPALVLQPTGQYLMSTPLPGNMGRLQVVQAISTPSTPTIQQPLAFSALNVCLAPSPMMQTFMSSQATLQPVVQQVIFGYPPQMTAAAQSPAGTQYRPQPTAGSTLLPPGPVQALTYTQLNTCVLPGTSPAGAVNTAPRTQTPLQTFPPVWHR